MDLGPLICNNAGFLKALAKSKSEQKRRRILRRASTAELLCIVEICLNIVKNRHLHLTTNQKTKILPYIDFVRQMSRIRTERGARRMVQKGNGYGVGIYAAIFGPIILEIAKSLLSNQI